jgi:hypothetical protein
LFDFDEDSGLGRRMTQSEVGAAFAGLIFRPNGAYVVCVPAKFLEKAEDDALGDGLFVRVAPLAQAGCDIANG